MTTTNIDGIDAVFDAARVVHDSAQRRHRELIRDEQRAAQEHTRNLAALATAARVAEARRADEAARANEERDQLAAILNVIDTPVDDTPVDEPTLPPPDVPATTATTVITDDDPVPPATTTATTTTTTRVNHAHPRNWGKIAWVTAIIGAIIALIIAGSTWDWFVNRIIGDNDWDFVEGVLALLWYVVLIGLGFFLGGLIGSLIVKPAVDGFRGDDNDDEETTHSVTRVITRRRQDPPQAD